MAEVDVKVGDKTYTVACDPGEELEVQTAADEFDVEAQKILGSIGKVPEVKLLLMAGLMLGGRLKISEKNEEIKINEVKSLENQINDLLEKSNLIKSEANPIKEAHAKGQTRDTEKPESSCAVILQSILTKLEDLLLNYSDLPSELKVEKDSEKPNKGLSEQKELF